MTLTDTHSSNKPVLSAATTCSIHTDNPQVLLLLLLLLNHLTYFILLQKCEAHLSGGVPVDLFTVVTCSGYSLGWRQDPDLAAKKWHLIKQIV